MTTATIAPPLLQWFDVHGRHDLPWQHPRTPYRVWLSEIMLQQTQVAVVIDYFQRFIHALPDLRALANAPLDDVLALWSGLGYYSRARNLHAAAKRCMEHHGGELPRRLDALIALPGIGRSTAGAILAQAWGDAAPILDGNVKRVFSRYFGIEGWPGTPRIEQQLWALAEAQLPNARLADYTQALMDLGATVCTRSKPDCTQCPLRCSCLANLQGRTNVLPTQKPSKPLPQRSAQMLIITDAEQRILLQRRPAAGIWAQLWSLPEFENDADAERWFENQFQQTLATATPQPALLHGFSHYRLLIQPRLIAVNPAARAVRDNDDLRWVTRTELASLGLPAPVRKLLQE